MRISDWSSDVCSSDLWFYLGGLDNWRIAFNQDWDRAFQPPKKHFRSDNIDSQRGAAEWDGGNLYFNQTGYDFDWQILPDKQGRTQRQTTDRFPTRQSTVTDGESGMNSKQYSRRRALCMAMGACLACIAAAPRSARHSDQRRVAKDCLREDN